MDRLRVHDPNGRVVATSLDGVSFNTADGTHFAKRVDDVFQMADGSMATLVGPVVFMPNSDGVQTRAFWLESDG